MTELPIFIGKLKRGLRRMWYWDIWHLQPSAPLSWRYILLNQSAQIKMHRHLWWHSRYKLPGLLWLPLELARWLHWRLRAAPRNVKKAVEYYGTDVEERFGIPVNIQSQQLTYWAKAWCIDPYTGYNWQLFRPDMDGLGIVYDNQTSAFHMLQNRKTGASKADHRLLGDKIALAEKLSALGIPMVATAQVSQGEWQDLLSALVVHLRLFCKLRSGNQGESAFAIWRDENGMQGLALDGTDLPNEQALRTAWQTLCAKGEVLIQPLLENHAAFSAASVDCSVMTLRVVTHVALEGISVWWAELQVPGEVSPKGGRGSWRFPVSVVDGAVLALGRECFLKQAWQDEYDALWQGLSALQRVPYWQQICQHSLQAHQELPKVWAIAWDWVITPDGPILLEGNGGWGLEQAQQQLGGFAGKSLLIRHFDKLNASLSRKGGKRLAHGDSENSKFT